MIRVGGGDGPRKIEPIVPIPKSGDKPREQPKGGDQRSPQEPHTDKGRERPKPKPDEPGYNVDIEV